MAHFKFSAPWKMLDSYSEEVQVRFENFCRSYEGMRVGHPRIDKWLEFQYCTTNYEGESDYPEFIGALQAYCMGHIEQYLDMMEERNGLRSSSDSSEQVYANE
jgi:hypothetical protein